MSNAGFRKLEVYQLAYQMSMRIFELSKKFPKEEKYALTDQIRRASRSVAQNLAEAYRKRRYPNHFISKLTDSDGEAAETTVCIDFALDCGYINKDEHKLLREKYSQIGRILGSMILHPDRFAVKSK